MSANTLAEFYTILNETFTCAYAMACHGLNVLRIKLSDKFLFLFTVLCT